MTSFIQINYIYADNIDYTRMGSISVNSIYKDSDEMVKVALEDEEER